MSFVKFKDINGRSSLLSRTSFVIFVKSVPRFPISNNVYFSFNVTMDITVGKNVERCIFLYGVPSFKFEYCFVIFYELCFRLPQMFSELV